MKTSPSEKSLFADALEQGSPEARAAYLRHACAGDQELLRRVEALLRAAEQAGDFLEHAPAEVQPPLDRTIDPQTRAHSGDLAMPEEQPGNRIGRYQLLEKIGEGGCGIVYLAEQAEPVRRRVALKVIKLGMDSRAFVARFEAERQALALMDHPNIARVFDGGATPTGRPYFVMELVRGVRITDFCAEARLDTGARLRLFVQVCQAVQHAHQKGVIHRDLKPSNILVTVNDGAPVPKVIDFGIAKGLGTRLTDKTLFTSFHAFIGTPAYTSPEQAEMSSLDVDTRSDIYSLGVLLYELLTGFTPFDGDQLLRSGLDEMRRVIRHTDPPKPSTRLTQELRRLRTRGESPRAHCLAETVHAVRGDLDWIVMKCLEKDRTRRYETANGLAADVLRHLVHDPIVARPPGQFYRVRKFIRRNRTSVAAMVATALALVTGTVLSVSQAIRAHRGEQRANAALAELRASAPFYAEQAHRLAGQGRFPEALEKLEDALRFDPENHRFLESRANLLESQLRWEEAIATYRKALALGSQGTSLRRHLELCEQLLTLDADRGPRWQEALSALLVVMSAEGRPETERIRIADLVLERSRLRLEPMAAVQGRSSDQLLRHFPPGLFALDLDGTTVTDLTPTRGIPLGRVTAQGSSLVDLRPLAGQRLISVDLSGTKVGELQPLRGIRTLRDLALDDSAVTSLAPLAGMGISWLSAQGLAVSDLSPLQGLPLRVLRIRRTQVVDLSPLAGMPLEELDVAWLPATDFGPLADCPNLRLLDLSHTRLRALEALRGLPLTSLRLAHTEVRDLTPLAGMPLRVLDLFGTRVTGVSPLQECGSLQSLVLPEGARNVKVLRSLPELTRISYRRDAEGEPAQLADDFWKQWDRPAPAER